MKFSFSIDGTFQENYRRALSVIDDEDVRKILLDGVGVVEKLPESNSASSRAPLISDFESLIARRMKGSDIE